MATEKYLLDYGRLKAAGDYSTKQFYIVKLDSTAEQFVLCGADEVAFGVLQDKPTSGKVGLIRIEGTSKVVASGAISYGAKVYSDANGKATATGTTNPIGIALEDASANGDIIEVRLIPKC